MTALQWTARAVVYAALGAYLVTYCTPIMQSHPEPVVAVLSESAGRCATLILTALLAYVDMGAALLLGCCVMTTSAEIDVLSRI